jgi:hypothetical protein
VKFFVFQISQPFETTVFYHPRQQAGVFQTAHPGSTFDAELDAHKARLHADKAIDVELRTRERVREDVAGDLRMSRGKQPHGISMQAEQGKTDYDQRKGTRTTRHTTQTQPLLLTADAFVAALGAVPAEHDMNSRHVVGKKQKVSEEGSTTEAPTDRAKKRRSTKEEPCARLNSDDLFKVSRDKNCQMPSVLVKKSNYENAGLGLFANENISKGTKVTECGGEIICFQSAQELAKTNQDTHCLALEPRFLAIDGRVRNQFTTEWYCTHHKAGAFVNSAIDPKKRNAKYKCCAANPPYIQPYKNQNSPDLRCSQKRIYIVATRNIQKGEEITKKDHCRDQTRTSKAWRSRHRRNHCR